MRVNHSKPDLLLILVTVLGIGVLVTSYGGHFFGQWLQAPKMMQIVSR